MLAKALCQALQQRKLNRVRQQAGSYGSIRANPFSAAARMHLQPCNNVQDPTRPCALDWSHIKPFGAALVSTSRTQHTPINFAQKYALFSEQWEPKVIAQMNDYQFKLARLEGEFLWHSHADTDETFIVLEGCLRIDFADGFVELNAGELFVVPKGVEHKPFAAQEVKLMLIEPSGVINTGSDINARTAQNDVWI